MSETVKYCRDCKCYKRNHCGPDFCIDHRDISIIDGEPTWRYCIKRRVDANDCGEDAKLFVPLHKPEPNAKGSDNKDGDVNYIGIFAVLAIAAIAFFALLKN